MISGLQAHVARSCWAFCTLTPPVLSLPCLYLWLVAWSQVQDPALELHESVPGAPLSPGWHPSPPVCHLCCTGVLGSGTPVNPCPAGVCASLAALVYSLCHMCLHNHLSWTPDEADLLAGIAGIPLCCPSHALLLICSPFLGSGHLLLALASHWRKLDGLRFSSISF